MPFKWTEAQTRQANIVDTETFDKAYNSVKGVINGGLDRENLRDASVGDAHLSPKAFLKYALRNDIHIQGATNKTLPNSTSGARDYVAIGFDTYTGGWKTNSAQGLTSLYKEGMLHVEYNGWYWLSNRKMGSAGSNRVMFRVLLDGSPIMETGMLFQNVGQVHLVGDFPIPTGTHTLEVSWQIVGTTDRPVADALFYYDGGSLLALNRYR
tara:strand:- start:805 stop:1434 length:630 start_codon:yes stop_codon:yes gene_type:complete